MKNKSDLFVETLRLRRRAETAEATVARVEAYRDRLESMTEADRHYAKGIEKALGGTK